MICTKHKHSSPFRAAVCYEKAMRKRVHRKTAGDSRPLRYEQASHSPPLEVDLGFVKVLYFYSGRAKVGANPRGYV